MRIKSRLRTYVGSIWDNVIAAISESRGISAEQLNLLADNLSGNIASTALDEKLVDGILYRNELIDTLKSLSGSPKKRI